MTNECRICFSNIEDFVNPLIVPCKCTGTQKFIHVQCLTQCRIHNCAERCLTCLFEYQVEEAIPAKYVPTLFIIIIILTIALLIFLVSFFFKCVFKLCNIKREISRIFKVVFFVIGFLCAYDQSEQLCDKIHTNPHLFICIYLDISCLGWLGYLCKIQNIYKEYLPLVMECNQKIKEQQI